MTIEVMKQALEALELHAKQYPHMQKGYTVDAITSLRQAIAEAEAEKQEPVAWVDLLKAAEQIVKDKFLYKRFIDGTPLANDIPCWMADFVQQYTHPQPKREWVGLTDEEIGSEYVRFGIQGGFNRFEYAVKALEAKLKEKNT
jgi:hypothetical protein